MNRSRFFEFVLPSILLGFIVGSAIGFYMAPIQPQPIHEYQDIPNRETDIVCYKMVDNGTAEVYCPVQKIYAPESVVNLTIKHCNEYEFVVDEPHICYG